MSKTTPERLPDIYFTLDYPVLLEVGRWELTGHPNGTLQAETIAQRLGESKERVVGALVRLSDADYIEVRTLPGDNRVLDADVKGMLPAGLQEVGTWPKGEDLAAILREVLEAQIHMVERLDPERGQKARKALGLLASTGTEFMAGLAQALVKAYLHLP